MATYQAIPSGRSSGADEGQLADARRDRGLDVGSSVRDRGTGDLHLDQRPGIEHGGFRAPGQKVIEDSMARRWYVVNTYSGFEQQVKNSIEQRVKAMGLDGKIFTIMVPTEQVAELQRGGKKKVTERKFFPGYILVEMDLDEEAWHVIEETPRVTGFVKSGELPTPLSEEEVEFLRGQISGNARAKPKPKILFDKGETVKITDGSFMNFTGTVNEVNLERGKLRVMVTIFGRPTPVEVDFTQVEKV